MAKELQFSATRRVQNQSYLIASDSFSYSCSYVNNDNFVVNVGDTAATNEMCMAIGYYFPAGSAYCN